VQSDLQSGDYMIMNWAGNWNFNLTNSWILTGVQANSTSSLFSTQYTSTTSSVILKNFQTILPNQQVIFYIFLTTPLTANTYVLTASTYRSSGAVV
jgi:hypothetical protein